MKVHQALHGYAEGHQQLAASIRLGPKDNRTLLAMSDLPGPGARLSNDGYLTGYPLAESGVYALARTWPAPEMARPGCVWTHTLFVEFTDLATIGSLASLLPLFKRPSPPGWRSYGAALQFAGAMEAFSFPELAREWTLRLLTGLYGRPMSGITAMRPAGVDVERVIVEIWTQQWPRLRRNFRFCTHSGADRSSESSAFDLQILPGEGHRSRFARSVDIESLPVIRNPWISSVYEDLRVPDANGLRSFMRTIGTEVSGGREVFRDLCQLHELVAEPSPSRTDVVEAIGLLTQSPELGCARGVQAIVARAALPWIAGDEDALTRFVVDRIPVLPVAAIAEHAAELGRALWRTSPSLFAEAWQQGQVGTSLRPLLRELSPAEIAKGLVDAVRLAPAIARERHDVLSEPVFWNAVTVSELPELISAVPNDVRDTALRAIMRSHRLELVEPACQAFGALAVFHALTRGDAIDTERWLAAAVRDRGTVVQFLQEAEGISTDLLAELARANAVRSNEVGETTIPWLRAFRQASPSAAPSDECYLHAFIFSVGFDCVTSDAAECVVATFEWLHREAASERITDEAWALLDARLPKLLWRDWDRCARMRVGVCEAFVRNDWDVSCFIQLAQDEELFLSLAHQMSWSSPGRRYLARSADTLDRAHDRLIKSRVETLRRHLFLKD